MLRGHKIEMLHGEWVYSDTKEPTKQHWKGRPCGHCGLHNTPEGHDGCLRALPNVINACCGHGETNEAYVQFTDKTILENKEALKWISANSEHEPY